jgi:hypothetical protein
MKKKAAEWSRLSGIEIIDPDGWDRRGEYFDADWNKEITLDEFFVKAMRSTTRGFHGNIQEVRRIVFKNL